MSAFRFGPVAATLRRYAIYGVAGAGDKYNAARVFSIRQAAGVVAREERACLQRARRPGVHGAREPRVEWLDRAAMLHNAKRAVLDLLEKP